MIIRSDPYLIKIYALIQLIASPHHSIAAKEGDMGAETYLLFVGPNYPVHIYPRQNNLIPSGYMSLSYCTSKS